MKKIILALAAALSFSSCEYLDIIPESKATEADIWKTTKQAEAYRYYMRTYMPNRITYDWNPDLFAGDDMMTGGVGNTYWFSYKSLLYDEETASTTYSEPKSKRQVLWKCA